MPAYGNDFATATLIDVQNQVLDGELISGTNPDDYFRIVLSQHQDWIQIYQSLPSQIMGIYIRLYDANEVELDQANSYASGGTNANILFTDLAPGTYYIVISRSGGTWNDYQLTMVADHTYPTTVVENDVSGLHGIFDQWYSTQIYRDEFTIIDQIDPNLIGTIYKYEYDVETLGYIVPETFFKPKIKSLHDSQGVSSPILMHNHGNKRMHIAGTVKEGSNSLPNKLVRLYDRLSGQMLDETRSDIRGDYKFNRILYDDLKYYVIAFDDDLNPINQAVIHDALIAEEF